MFGLAALATAVRTGERVLETVEHVKPIVIEALDGMAKMEKEIEEIRKTLDKKAYIRKEDDV